MDKKKKTEKKVVRKFFEPKTGRVFSEEEKTEKKDIKLSKSK